MNDDTVSPFWDSVQDTSDFVKEHIKKLCVAAQGTLSDREFEALLAIQEFEDEKDWRSPPERWGAYYYCPLRFLAYLRHFNVEAVAPPECAKWEKPSKKSFARLIEIGKDDYTYFARGRYTGAIKIGRSTQPEYRISTLHHDQNGEPATELVIIPDGDFELPYHNIFSRWRAHGEWFAPHPDILAEIERLTPHPQQEND